MPAETGIGTGAFLTFPIFMQAFLLSLFLFFSFSTAAQDSLRGSNGPGRDFWDVTQYTLRLEADPVRKTVEGEVAIDMHAVKTADRELQIDLQQPLAVTGAGWGFSKTPAEIRREGNVCWVAPPAGGLFAGRKYTLHLAYKGSPQVAQNPPWDGGLIWRKDGNGKPWAAVACQGAGASVWFPCKDFQSDEPDSGAILLFKRPPGLDVIANGRRMTDVRGYVRDTAGWTGWRVTQTINPYNITFYLGDYISWKDTLAGEGGTLDLSYYALRENEQKARKQFQVVKPMLHCFESWLGKYPFYADGYKLVEAPYLGMEHQSAVAYGNDYKMGYKGYDRSNTGVGLKFDYIIIHETAHEWWGNSITARDVADNWIHEGFATYTESLFAECLLGKPAGEHFQSGEQKNIDNDRPVIGTYGLREEGSGDQYDKGATVVRMLRALFVHDLYFRQALRLLNKTYFHKTVTSAEIEAFWTEQIGRDLKPVFDVYLRRAALPRLEWYRDKQDTLWARFTQVPAGFSLPLFVPEKETTVDSAFINRFIFEPHPRFKYSAGEVDATWRPVGKGKSLPAIPGAFLVETARVKGRE